MAPRWHLRPGSRVSLTTQAASTTFTVIGVGGSDADNGLNVYMSLEALQAATGHPGVDNTVLIRAVDHNHAAIDALAGRLEDTLARAGYTSRSG